MRQLTLPGTAIRTSAVGFGCGTLLRVPSRSAREGLLHAAFEGGIRHFDVARLYGLGAAEEELGRFAKGRRDQMVIATKFGLEPKPVARLIGRIQGPVRRMLAAYPTMRAAARRSAGFLNAHGRYDAATARSSLDASLRALRTDYIDILFLHEPMIDRIGDDLLGQLERERTAGRIRAFGVAGYPPALLAIQSELPAVTVVLQLPNDAIERQLERFPVRSGQAVITFSPFAGALEPLSQRLESDREFAATFALAYCLRANPTGVVLFSSTNPKRIRAAIRTADAPPAAGALAAFEAFVSAPPHAPSAAGIASGPPAAEQS